MRRHVEAFGISAAAAALIALAWILFPAARTFEWRGLDENGQPVPSGVYYMRLIIGAETHEERVTSIR